MNDQEVFFISHLMMFEWLSLLLGLCCGAALRLVTTTPIISLGDLRGEPAGSSLTVVKMSGPETPKPSAATSHDEQDLSKAA